MKQFACSFTGRIKGALGAFEKFDNIIVCSYTEAEVKIKLYDKYEHIINLTIEEII
jgi:hypothetical protein